MRRPKGNRGSIQTNLRKHSSPRLESNDDFDLEAWVRKRKPKRKPNIGGAAKTITLTMQEWGDALDHVYDMGVKSGLEAAERLSYVPPSCPMCKLKEEHDALARRLRTIDNAEPGHQRFA